MGLLAALSIIVALSYLAFGGALMAMSDMRSVAQQRVDRYASLATRFAARYLENEAVAWERTRWQGSPAPFAPGAMPAATLCVDGTTCGVSATASYAIDGTADAYDGTNTVIAPNVEQNARELRIAATMTVTVVDRTGTPIIARPVLVKVRVFGSAGAEVTELQDSAARSTRALAGAGENEGCAPDGSGCDPDRTTTVAPTTVDAVNQCLSGVGSGTCPSTGVLPYASKANVTWTNRQSGATTTGP